MLYLDPLLLIVLGPSLEENMAPLVGLVQLEKNSQLSNLREQVPFLELTALSEPGHLEGAEEVTFLLLKNCATYVL